MGTMGSIQYILGMYRLYKELLSPVLVISHRVIIVN